MVQWEEGDRGGVSVVGGGIDRGGQQLWSANIVVIMSSREKNGLHCHLGKA
jgi:hypothetical protein